MNERTKTADRNSYYSAGTNIPIPVEFQTRVRTTAMPFVCSICSRDFASEKYLSMHMSLHKYAALNPDQPDPTDIRLDQPEVQQQQQSSRAEEPAPASCPICNKIFSHGSNYKNHMRTHSDERPFVCSLCSIGFKERYHLKKHVLFKHTTDLKEKCRFCGRLFKDSTAVRAHERIHSETRPYGCKLCGKTFKTSECLWHHENRSKTCGKAAVAAAAILTGSDGGQDGIVMVQTKPKRKRAGMHKHAIVTTDLGCRPDRLEDPVGLKTVDSYQTRNDEIVSEELLLLTPEPEVDMHTADDNGGWFREEVWEDGVCSHRVEEVTSTSDGAPSNQSDPSGSADTEEIKVAASSRRIRTQPPVNGGEERPYQCALCDHSFKMKVHLKKHHLYRHTDEYPCECSICGKRFKDTSAVHLHERIHSSNRPFKCTCGKSFKTRENLWGHRSRNKPCNGTREFFAENIRVFRTPEFGSILGIPATGTNYPMMNDQENTTTDMIQLTPGTFLFMDHGTIPGMNLACARRMLQAELPNLITMQDSDPSADGKQDSGTRQMKQLVQGTSTPRVSLPMATVVPIRRGAPEPQPVGRIASDNADSKQQVPFQSVKEPGSNQNCDATRTPANRGDTVTNKHVAALNGAKQQVTVLEDIKQQVITVADDQCPAVQKSLSAPMSHRADAESKYPIDSSCCHLLDENSNISSLIETADLVGPMLSDLLPRIDPVLPHSPASRQPHFEDSRFVEYSDMEDTMSGNEELQWKETGNDDLSLMTTWTLENEALLSDIMP